MPPLFIRAPQHLHFDEGSRTLACIHCSLQKCILSILHFPTFFFLACPLYHTCARFHSIQFNSAALELNVYNFLSLSRASLPVHATLFLVECTNYIGPSVRWQCGVSFNVHSSAVVVLCTSHLGKCAPSNCVRFYVRYVIRCGSKVVCERRKYRKQISRRKDGRTERMTMTMNFL